MPGGVREARRSVPGEPSLAGSSSMTVTSETEVRASVALVTSTECMFCEEARKHTEHTN